MEVYQDHSFQVDSHSVPNAPMGIIRLTHQERVKGLGQKWVFLQMGAKSSTKHVSGGKELASTWVLTVYFGCGNAGIPICALTQEPGTCGELSGRLQVHLGASGTLDMVSHSRQEGLCEFVPEPV